MLETIIVSEPMVPIAAKLDARMKKWRPHTTKEVERRVAEIIELADIRERRRERSIPFSKVTSRLKRDKLL